MRVIYGAYVECKNPVMVPVLVKRGKKWQCRGPEHHVFESSCGEYAISKCTRCNAPVDDITPEVEEIVTAWKQATKDDRDKITSRLDHTNLEKNGLVRGVGNHEIYYEHDGKSRVLLDYNVKDSAIHGIKDEESFKASFMESCGQAIDELKKYYGSVEVHAGIIVQPNWN